MNLTNVIIGILLSALAVGISVTFYGSVFSEGSAQATASKLASQGQQIVDSASTFAAMNAGQRPADMDDLLEGGVFLSAAPTTGIESVVWEYNAANHMAVTTTGISDTVCQKAYENAGGMDEEATYPADLAAARSGDFMYGCFGTGSDRAFFHK